MRPATFTRLLQSEPGCRRIVSMAVDDAIRAVEAGGQPLRVAPAVRPFHTVDHMHFHPVFEWVFQRCGRAVWHLAESRVEAPAGSILLLPRGVAHLERRHPRAAVSMNVNVAVAERQIGVHLHTDRPRVRPVGPGTWRLQVREADSEFVYQMLHELASNPARDGDSPGTVLRRRGVLLAALGALRAGLDGQSSRPARRGSHVVALCRQRVWHHLANPDLTVAMLAGEVGCSADYLSRLFHRETGQRLGDFIAGERLALARRLLTGTAMNVGQVARSCGHADPSYFSRVFKRHAGMSPRDWRRSMADPPSW
jgi:AraC-like DNA-binding protein